TSRCSSRTCPPTCSTAWSRRRRGSSSIGRCGSRPTSGSSARSSSPATCRRRRPSSRRRGRTARCTRASATRGRGSSRPTPSSTASYDMMESCDALLMVGTSFPYAEWLPKEGQAKCVEIDIKASMIGIRYPVDVFLIGDAKETLTELNGRLKRKEDRAWRETIEENVREWWRINEDRAMQDADPMNPQRVVHELSQRLPDDAIVTADSGSSTNWWARQLKLRRGNMASLSGTLATMGPGVPYAIAAK